MLANLKVGSAPIKEQGASCKGGSCKCYFRVSHNVSSPRVCQIVHSPLRPSHSVSRFSRQASLWTFQVEIMMRLFKVSVLVVALLQDVSLEAPGRLTRGSRASHSRLQGVSLEIPFPDSRPIFS